MYEHKDYTSNNFKGSISEYNKKDFWERSCLNLFHEENEMLSGPLGFVLHGKLGIDFFSTSELIYPSMKKRIPLIKVIANFYMISDNPKVSLGVVDCLFYTRRFALNDDYHKKRWTFLPILL